MLGFERMASMFSAGCALNSTEFNVTTGTLTIYLQWLVDFIVDNAPGASDDNFFDQSLNTTDNVTFFNVTSQNFLGNINASFIQNNNWIEDTQESSLNVNSSDFLDTAQGTISGINSTEFNVTTGTLTIYNQWLSDFISDIATGLTVAVESIRSANTFISYNASTGDVETTFNETRLNDTINNFLGNGTFTGFLANDGDTATGNYTFDSPTFFIDSTNNRVGFGTLTPRSPVTVKGDLNLTASSTSASGRIFHNGTGICIGACV